MFKEDHVRSVLNWSVPRINTLDDLVTNDFLFLWTVPPSTASAVTRDQYDTIDKLKLTLLSVNEEYSRDDISRLLKNFANENGIDFKFFMQQLRHILSGLKVRMHAPYFAWICCYAYYCVNNMS